METTRQEDSMKFEAIQMDGRPETDDLDRMWSVIDADGTVVASWRETPTIGMTQTDAKELAKAWSN